MSRKLETRKPYAKTENRKNIRLIRTLPVLTPSLTFTPTFPLSNPTSLGWRCKSAEIGVKFQDRMDIC